MRCATHPDVETGLTCSKCGKPICPRCMVQTPVGARCAECAKLSKLPTFKLSRTDYAKAVAVGLGAAVFSGILWYLIRWVTPFFMVFLNLLVAAGVGYGIGEATSFSVNRKRGLFLKIIAGICVLLSFVIGNQVIFPGHFIVSFNLFNILALAIGLYLAISRL
jgi:hypothetical protein